MPRHTAPPGRRRGSCKSPPSSPWRPRAPARSKRAQIFLDEALQIVDTTGERWLAAELNRRKGQLLLQRGRRCRRGALWPSAEHRRRAAGKTVGAACRPQPRPAALRPGLAGVGARSAGAGYTWFTKGFYTPDLEAAAALLGELSASSLDFSSISSAIKFRIWHAPFKKSRGKGVAASYPPWPSPAVWARSPMGYRSAFCEEKKTTADNRRSKML